MRFERGIGKCLMAFALSLLLASCGGGGGSEGGSSGGEDNSLTPHLLATTNAATNIADNNIESQAVLNASVNPGGVETTAWFEWDNNASFTSPTVIGTDNAGSGTTAVSFSTTLSGLESSTTYYFRVVASNSMDGSVQGETLSFRTGDYYVAIGDSITQGWGDTDNTAAGDGIGYEPVLQDLLYEAVNGAYPVTIHNAGIPGTISAQGADNIATVLAAHPNAKYFLIMYGTNDSTTKYFPYTAVPVATFRANMVDIVEAIQAAGKTPYLAKIPYTTNEYNDLDFIQAYNLEILDLVNDYGIPVVPPDFYQWYLMYPGELGDGLHPNNSGYHSMAELWFDSLTP